MLTDDFRPDSDIDLLVEFEPGWTPGLAIIDLEDELAALFGGRKVDLVSRKYLNRWIRDRVLAEAEAASRGLLAEAEADSRGRGIGLTGMRERITALHGTVDVDSTPSQGAKLTVRIPVPA